MKDVPYQAEIKEVREKRSLDSNAYLWVLIGKLSGVLGIPPVDIYREAIRDVGNNYEVMPIKTSSLEHWKYIWTSNGMGWIVEELGESKLKGYTNVMSFYGSSIYDKDQMSRLIGIIVEECKANGIETATPRELASMMDAWG